MKITAIVLAAGQGKRMQSKVHKQYLDLQGKPVLFYCLNCFEQSPDIDEIVLVTGEGEIDYCQREIVEKYHLTKVKNIVLGGKERFDSVENGLHAVVEQSQEDIVLIHDGARPFVTEQMIQNSIEAVGRHHACTVGVPVKDTIKVVDNDNFGIETPKRSTLWQIQTPQSFHLNIIKETYKRMREDNSDGITDDTMLVEKYMQIPVKIIEGDYRNIKITTPDDLVLAEAFVSNFSKNKKNKKSC